MLRHRGEDVQRLRFRQRLMTLTVDRGHSHALRNPTVRSLLWSKCLLDDRADNQKRPRTYPYQIAFSLPSSGVTMRGDRKKHNGIDFEASIHKFRIDTGDAPLEMTRDDESVRERCLRCEGVAKTWCPECNAASYCSDACRNDDEKFHAEVCGLLEDMEGTRPSTAHHRLICFAPEETAPSFLWVKAHFDETEGNLSFLFEEESIITAWAERQGFTTRTWMAPLAAQRSIFPHPLGHGLALLGAKPAHDDSQIDAVNWAVQALGKPGNVTPVFGPVFAFAYNTDRNGNLVSVADASLRDLTHVVDAILQAPCHPASPAPNRSRQPQCPALKLVDPRSGWHIALGVPAVEMVALPCWKSGLMLAVPFSLGLRWIVHPSVVPLGIRASTVWGEDSLSRLFGSVIVVRSGHDGVRGEMVFQRVLFWHGFSVTRSYGGVVHPLHVEGMLAYLAFARRLEGGASEAGFRAWWDDWKDGLVARGRKVSRIVGPYVEEDEEREHWEMDAETEGVLKFLKRMREGDGESIEDVFGDLVF
ncbi:hypothetical protein ACHAQH_008493 [Verticillium albo-atrum]